MNMTMHQACVCVCVWLHLCGITLLALFVRQLLAALGKLDEEDMEADEAEDRDKAGGSVAACPPLPSAGSSSSEPPAARTRDEACAPGWGSEAACPPCPSPQTFAWGGHLFGPGDPDL